MRRSITLSIEDEIEGIVARLVHENTAPNIAVRIAKHSDLIPDLSYDWEKWATDKGLGLTDTVARELSYECMDCGEDAEAHWEFCPRCGEPLGLPPECIDHMIARIVKDAEKQYQRECKQLLAAHSKEEAKC